MISIVVSEEKHAKILTLISKSAFDTDVLVGADLIGGPPNYDSEKWHMRMIKSKKMYSIICDSEIIGGIILFKDKIDAEVMYVGRIFIKPELFKKGYGIQAMKEIENMYSKIKYWRLETPNWNVRTNSFYLKLGYVPMKREGNSVFYQKSV